MSMAPCRKTSKVLGPPQPTTYRRASVYNAGSEIIEIFRGRPHASQEKMFASARAGNVEQSPLGFVDFVKFSLVRRVGDALVQRQDALITRHYGYGAEFEPLGEVHRGRGDSIAFS